MLWPEADVRLWPARPSAGLRAAEAFAVLPNATRPRFLVPCPVPASVDPGDRPRDRPASDVAWGGRWPGFGTMAAGRLRPRPPVLVVSYDRDPRPGELLTQYARSVFGRPDVSIAVSLERPSPTRVPAVQVLSLEDEVLASGRIGWNGTTRALLEREAAAIARWERRPPVAFRVPNLLHKGGWGPHTVTFTSPVGIDGGGRGRGHDLPGPEVTLEIAGSGGVGLAPFSSTGWWRSVIERAGSVSRAAAEVLGWMQDLHGRRLIWHGSWHGDWDPSHMASSHDGLLVWGWERAGDGVPLGLDPINLESGAASARRNGARAARSALQRSDRMLRSLGVPAEDDALLMACYLAELLARSGETAPGGRTIGTTALLDELRRWVARA